MKLKRIVHPVGAAAFITETFYDGKKRVFDVVYDCGHKCDQKYFYCLIDNHFDNGATADILFVSHFDEDHYDGVEYMISKGYCVSGKTVAYLPLLDDYTFLILKYCSNSAFLSLISLLTKTRIKIIFVKPIDDNIDFPHSNLSSDDIIPSGQPITNSFSGVWEYIPFYAQDNSIILTLSSALRADPDLSSLDFQNFDNWTDENIQKFRALFNSINKPYGVTGINMSAVLLISKNQSIIVSNNIKTSSSNPTIKAITNTNNGICLYTSDCGLKSKCIFDNLCSTLNSNGANEMNLFQIPHHGSRNNYNPDFYSGRFTFDNVFVNGVVASKNPVFYSRCISDATQNNKPLFIVDKTPQSRFEQDIEF